MSLSKIAYFFIVIMHHWRTHCRGCLCICIQLICFITDCWKFKGDICVGMTSNEIMCVPNFVKISHQVPELNWTHTHTEHGYCVSVFWFHFRRKFAMNLWDKFRKCLLPYQIYLLVIHLCF